VLLAAGIRNLVVGHHPEGSPLGIAYLVIAASAMFTLAFRKRALSAQLESHSLVHEARVTFLDGALATTVLLALVANLAFGWWWADAGASIAVAFVAVGEGVVTPRRHG
jgi:divalent metal cation (Fe/Co/Zn/Cd) transporter